MFSANKGESTQFIVSFWMIALWRNVEIISRFDFSAVKSTHMYCKMGIRDKFRLQWVAKSNLHQIIIGGGERLISWGEVCTDVKIMFLKIWSVCLTFSLVKITFKTTFNFQICNFKCSRWYEMVKPKLTFFCTSSFEVYIKASCKENETYEHQNVDTINVKFHLPSQTTSSE